MSLSTRLVVLTVAVVASTQFSLPADAAHPNLDEAGFYVLLVMDW